MKKALFLLVLSVVCVIFFSFVCSILYFGVTLILDMKFRYQVPIGYGLILTVLTMFIGSNKIADEVKKIKK